MDSCMKGIELDPDNIIFIQARLELLDMLSCEEGMEEALYVARQSLQNMGDSDSTRLKTLVQKMETMWLSAIKSDSVQEPQEEIIRALLRRGDARDEPQLAPHKSRIKANQQAKSKMVQKKPKKFLVRCMTLRNSPCALYEVIFYAILIFNIHLIIVFIGTRSISSVV